MKPRVTLTTKVFLLAFINFLLLSAVFLVFMRVQYRFDIQWFILSPARDRILSVGRQLALELRETDPANWNELLDRYSRLHNVELRLVDEEGTHVAGAKDPLPAQVLERFGQQEGMRRGRRRPPLMSLGTTYEPTRYWVGVRIPIPAPGEQDRKYGALLAASSSWMSPFVFDPKPYLAIGSAFLLVSIICWLPFVRGLTKSISHISRATAQMAEGHFEVQLPVKRRDEIGKLSASINRMASRLAGFVTGQKRFLGDTAHELSSPIARMQVALGILERNVPADQQELVADLKDDVQHMSALVNDVLSFSKASMRPAKANLSAVSVAETVGRVLDREAIEEVQFTSAIDERLHVLADPDLLFRALCNVVRNSIRYAGSAGPIEISARAQDGSVTIRVADSGPGLAEKDLDAVFEPFYRPESARARETGGVGLGLAIVKTCIESCGGTVQCRNRKPHGLEVDLTLKPA